MAPFWITLLLLWNFNTLAFGEGGKILGPCESWFPAQGAPRAVLVVTHGLNLKPERMDTMAKEFAAAGFEVYRPAFSGHCGANEKYLNVKAVQWELDARRIYANAQARAAELKVPIQLVAYSFSALVFEAMSKEIPFDRKVLLAPALRTKFWFAPLIWAASLYPEFTYHSLSLDGYFANATSGMRPLFALREFLDRLGGGPNNTVPTLVWVDPLDELVSARGLKEISAKQNAWSLRELSNVGSTLPKKYHHLIVDPAVLGQSEWQRLMKESKEFLLIKSPAPTGS